MLVSERYILLRFSHCPAMLNRGADVGVTGVQTVLAAQALKRPLG